MKKLLLAITALFAFATASMAQSFPTTEAEVKTLLCKTWEASKMKMGEQEINMEDVRKEIPEAKLEITFKTDGTCIIDDGTKQNGTYTIDMEKKKIIFRTNEDQDKTTEITSLTKTELVFEQKNEEGEGKVWCKPLVK
jgi:hypothetical protein